MRRERPEPGSPTQLAAARAGVVTPEMAYAAARENANLEGFAASLSEPGLERVRDRLMPLLERVEPWTGERVRARVAARQAVIPAAFTHPEVEPTVIGRHFATKVNANVGTSASSSDWREEGRKMQEALARGADTVMDLSTGRCIRETREMILRGSPVPVGTVPLYETLTLHTWPTPPSYVVFGREFEGYGESGEKVLVATSRWCAVDFATGKLLLSLIHI